jgi:hypothetical protein
VTGSREHGDEPSGSGTTELISWLVRGHIRLLNMPF